MKRSRFIVSIAMLIVGIALVAVAVLMVLFGNDSSAVAAPIGVPGLALIAASGLVLTAPSRRQ
ncbi:MAG: hypothetical protein R6X31_10820 [Anaerolineae bacterium]